MRHTDHPSSPRRSRRLLGIGAGLIAALAAALVLALAGGSGSSSGLGAGDAIAQAAGDTAAVRSGVLTTVAEVAGTTTSTVVRFDGDDAEATFDDPQSGTRRTILVVGGRGYQRDADGAWQELDGESGAPVVDQLRNQLANPALVEAVRSADGVTSDGGVHRAHLSAEDLAGVGETPLGLGATPPAEGATVAVAVGDDGLLRSVTLEAPGVRYAVTYSGLGEPQGLEAPPAG